jgi:hypothetical protein
LYVKVTVPDALVVAVNVTGWPATAGSGDAETEVVVAVAACAIGTETAKLTPEANVSATKRTSARGRHRNIQQLSVTVD